MTKYKLVLVWLICLSCAVVMTGGEVVWVNRNVADNFRVGQDGCTNDTSVCTNVSATCRKSDGSCLCVFRRPSYRNPVLEALYSKIVYGNSYGCIDDDIIRFSVTEGISINCPFSPFQVIPYSHTDAVTKFSYLGQIFNCSLKKAFVKFPDNATETELQWLNESYVDLNVSNNDLYFKWKRSVPDLQATIITFILHCLVPSSTGSFAFQTKCLRAKVFGTWSAEVAPTTTEPTVTSKQLKTSQITSEATLPVTRKKAKSTASDSLNEESSDSNVSTKVFIALFSISLVVNIVLGIIVWFLWKDRQRNQDKNLQVKEMQNIDEHRRTNTGNEISVYDVVVNSGIHNDGIYDETRASSGHNNNNGRLSDHKYEEPSNYEPLRRNPSKDESDDHNYQSLTRPQM